MLISSAAPCRRPVLCARRRVLQRALQSEVAAPNGDAPGFTLADGYAWEAIPLPALEPGGRAYSETQRVRSHEVGADRRSSLMTISNILQARPARRALWAAAAITQAASALRACASGASSATGLFRLCTRSRS